MISFLDQDLYTFTVGQAVMEHYPDVEVEYEFKDRKGIRFFKQFLQRLEDNIDSLEDIVPEKQEIDFLRRKCPYIKPHYLEYLSSYRFNRDEVDCRLVDEKLCIKVIGYWHRTIFWEVPLLSTICETYYGSDVEEYTNSYAKEGLTKARIKSHHLRKNGVNFADFGTRRRHSYCFQRDFNSVAKENDFYLGTSNTDIANFFNVKPIGTMSHQWIMGISALESLRHANRFAMEKWVETYDGSLGIMLPDTFGTEAFFKDFTGKYPKLFDGVRHDSGCPYKFGDRVIQHYKEQGIDPTSKTIVFSDGLTTEKAVAINSYFKDRIKCSFGIGTHFTNDVDGVDPMNIVIKLSKVNNIPVVKLSDEPGKEIGDAKALDVAKWTFGV